MRALLAVAGTALATAAATYALGNALADHDWLVAASAGLLVCVGIWGIFG